MRRALAKPHVRVAAVDDGAFGREDRWAPVAVVIASTPSELEGVLLGAVRVDGTDATDRVVALLRSSSHLDGIRAVLVDGVVLGGFNVLDLPALAREVERPVVAVTRRRPDLAKIRAAVRKYFPRDARLRLARLAARPLFPVPTGARPIYAACAGCTRADAVRLVQRTAVRGFWPEPLRLAHLIARAAGEAGAVRAPGGRTLKGGAEDGTRGPVA